MKTSKFLLSTLVAAAAMTASAYADYVWSGGDTITQELWETESSWTLTDDTAWPEDGWPANVGTDDPGSGPLTPNSNIWNDVTIADASGSVSLLEGWNIGLTLTNTDLTVTQLKKFQGGGTITMDASSVLTISSFTGGNDGGTITLNNEGTFNLAYTKNQGGEGFIANLGSTGVMNLTSSNGTAYTAKIKSLSATLDSVVETAGAGIYASRKLITIDGNISFDGTETTFTFLDTDSNELSVSTGSVGSIVVNADGTYGVEYSKTGWCLIKNSLGYSVAYSVAGTDESAEVLVWNGSTSNDWNTTDTNWDGSSAESSIAFSAEQNVVFNKDAAVTVGEGVTAGLVAIFNNATVSLGNSTNLTASSIQVDAGSTLDLGVESLGTLNKNIVGDGTIVWGNSAGSHGTTISLSDEFTGTLKISGNIAGGDKFYLGGAKKLIADGVWFWSGGGAINNEALEVEATGSNTFDAAVTVGTVNISGGTTTFSGATDIDTLTVSGGTANLNGTTNVGTLSITEGTATLGSGKNSSNTLSFGSISVGGVLAFNHADWSMTNDITFKDGSTLRIVDGTNDYDVSTSLTISGGVTLEGTTYYESEYKKETKIDGKITGDGGFTFTGTPNATWGGAYARLVLTNAENDFSGGITITRETGEVRATCGGALGTGTVNLENSTSRLWYAGTEADDASYDSISNAFTGSGTLTIASGKVKTTGDLSGFTGTVSVADGLTFAVENASDMSVSATISATNASFEKLGAGVLTLSNAANEFSSVTVSEGTLVATSSSALGTGDVTVNGTLSLGTSAVSVTNLSGDGTVRLLSGVQSSTLTVNSTEDTTFSGSLTTGVFGDDTYTLSLVKRGTGALVLDTAANLGNGSISVEEGTLVATNDFAFGSITAVSVSDGANVKLTGVQSGGYGLYVGSLAFESGSKLIVDFSNLAVTADADSTDSLALNILCASTITFGDTALSSETLSTDVLSEYVTFANNEALFELYKNQEWSYDGNALTLTLSIPEPSAFGLLAGLGAVALAVSRRKRRA